MTVHSLRSFALKLPDREMDVGRRFYSSFGLNVSEADDGLEFCCEGRTNACARLIAGHDRKQLGFVELACNPGDIGRIADAAEAAGARLALPVAALESEGLWLQDPFGVVVRVTTAEKQRPIAAEPEFQINSPGILHRVGAPALPPRSQVKPACPRRLGHVLMFTPDVEKSIRFYMDVLGMRLSDRSGEIIAFLHCQGGSDHHVLAFAKSSGVGFHHGSFQVGTPDEVGQGGWAMEQEGSQKGWGFGRHAIGSNFFYYVRDPWGSFVEYYSDIDYIADSDTWTATDWPAEDALSNWGPVPPADFITNREAGETPPEA
jgi:catechol 2,3-dioxygenase